MTDDSPPATECNRRRTIELSALTAVGSITALAGCGDEGPGDEGGDDQADHPDEVGNGNGGGGGPIDEEGPTGGDPEYGDEVNENESDEDG